MDKFWSFHVVAFLASWHTYWELGGWVLGYLASIRPALGILHWVGAVPDRWEGHFCECWWPQARHAPAYVLKQAQGSLRMKSSHTWMGPSQVALVVKNPPAKAGGLRDAGSISESGRSSGWGNVAHSSLLAWRIPWTEETGGVRSIGLQSQTRLKRLNTHTHTCTWTTVRCHCLGTKTLQSHLDLFKHNPSSSSLPPTSVHSPKHCLEFSQAQKKV